MPGGQPLYVAHDTPTALEAEFRDICRRLGRLDEQLGGLGVARKDGQRGPPGAPGIGLTPPIMAEGGGQQNHPVKTWFSYISASGFGAQDQVVTLQFPVAEIASPYIHLSTYVRVHVGQSQARLDTNLDVMLKPAFQMTLLGDKLKIVPKTRDGGQRGVQPDFAPLAFWTRSEVPPLGEYRMRSGPPVEGMVAGMTDQWEEHLARSNGFPGQPTVALESDIQGWRNRSIQGVPVTTLGGPDKLRVVLELAPRSGLPMIYDIGFFIVGTYIENLIDRNLGGPPPGA